MPHPALSVLALLLLQEAPTETPGTSRTVTAKDGETISLKVRISEEGRSFPTAVTLPEAVAHVLSAWDPKHLSLEHDGNRLFVTLLAKVEGVLDVVTAGGTHLRFHLVGVPAPAPHDSTVTVKIAPPPAAGDGKPLPRAGAVGALELVRAMRLGEVPSDATVRSGANEVLLRRGDIEVTVHYVYETGRYRGTVLGLANLSPKEAFHVDVSRFSGENLVLVGVKDLIVPPGKATRLYIVDWK